jgi:sulfate transport system ATP-binding protein
MSITAIRVTKRFGDFLALDNVSLEVPGGALLALLGPSGSGKTTLLRVIAGLETPDSGTVRYLDEDVTEASVWERNVGFVFQHYALFRHMSVFENIAFGLRVRHWPKAKVNERVRELLRLIQLHGIEKARPSQLSGGQRQRVALARALAAEPKVLLLDEPFGALDAKVRQDLRQWLRRLHDDIHVTTVFVTHDQEEAFEVADRVVIMNHGQVEQVGTPQEIFEQPASPFVMDFLGNVNVFHGHVQRGKVELGSFDISYPQHPHDERRPATAFIRSHDLEILRVKNGRPGLAAKVLHINPAGAIVKVRLVAVDFGVELTVNVDRERYEELRLKIDETVYASPRDVKVFIHDYQI